MRTFLAIAALAPLLFAAACGDDDSSSGADDEAACQDACEAAFADQMVGCDLCEIIVTFEDGDCSCEFLDCGSDLCDAWCLENQGIATGTCTLGTCTCP